MEQNEINVKAVPLFVVVYISKNTRAKTLELQFNIIVRLEKIFTITIIFIIILMPRHTPDLRPKFAGALSQQT